MAIYVEINPREREATLRSAHSLCAGESAEVVLSGIPDADTETLSLRLYRDRSEAEFVAAARRPGDADPPQEGFVAVQGRAAMRRAVLDLRSESVASWASDVFEQSESESDGPEGAPKPPETAWMVVADISRVWAACEVLFLLRPMSPESADVALTLPSLVERATAAAESAERSASAASASALEASQAAARAEAATSGKADLEDGKVPASQLPPFRGKTDLTVDPDSWVLVKPDGTKGILSLIADAPDLIWGSEDFRWALHVEPPEGEGGTWMLIHLVDPDTNLIEEITGPAAAPGHSDKRLVFENGSNVYRLYRATELATDADIARLLEGKQDALSALQLANIDAARWPSSVRVPSSGAVALLDRAVNVVDVEAVLGPPVARWTWSDGMDRGSPVEGGGTWYPPASLMSYEFAGLSEDGGQLVLEFRDGSAGAGSWFGGYDYAVLSMDSVAPAYGSPVRDESLSAAVGRDAGWLLVSDFGMDPVYMLFGVPVVTFDTGMSWSLDASGWDGVPLAVRRVQSFDGTAGTAGDEVSEFAASWAGMLSPSEATSHWDMYWDFSEGSSAGLFAVRDYYRPVESQSVSSLSLPAAPASGLRAFDVLWTAPEGISSASRPTGASYLAPDGAFPPLGGGMRLVSFREVSAGRFAVWHTELQEVT